MTDDIHAERRIHQLEAQLRSLQASSGWQPIDTVPKTEGVLVAVAFVHGDMTVVALTSWTEHPVVEDMHWRTPGGSFPHSKARYWLAIAPLPKERLN